MTSSLTISDGRPQGPRDTGGCPTVCLCPSVLPLEVNSLFIALLFQL